MTVDSIIMPRAGHVSIRVGADGDAWIEGYRCGACEAIMGTATTGCRRCGSRVGLEPFRAAQTGTLYSWCVVNRSYPGIAVPFLSAVVDLDGGPTIKGTLRLADINAVKQGMAVRLVLDDAGGAKDKTGAPYVGFHFEAQGAEV